MDKQKILMQLEIHETNLKNRVQQLDWEIEALRARRSECASALSDFQNHKDEITRTFA